MVDDDKKLNEILDASKRFFEANYNLVKYKKNCFQTKKFVGYLYTIKHVNINFDTIREIIGVINGVNEHIKNQKIPICFDLSQGNPNDKVTMNLLEMVAAHVTINCKQRLTFIFKISKNIVTEQMTENPIWYLSPGKLYDKEKFVESLIRIRNKKRIRTVYLMVKKEAKRKLLNEILFQYTAFCTFHSITERASRGIGRLVSELVENSITHANSAVIVDIDITDAYRNNENKKIAKGINLTVINMSNYFFYSGVKEKINYFRKNETEYQGETLYTLYKQVTDWHDSHQNYFDTQYHENHFWIMAALQHHVTGRKNNYTSNGVGMTKMMSMLQTYSADSFNYMTTEKIGIIFKDKFMKNNPKNLIAFNSNNDINEKPDQHVTKESSLFIPGTIFNLSFAIGKQSNGESYG